MPILITQPPQDDTREVQLQSKFKELRIKEKEDLAQISANRSGFPYVDLDGAGISPETLRLLTLEEAKKARAIVFARSGSTVHLGAVDFLHPRVAELIAKLEQQHGFIVKQFIISENSFAYALGIYAHVHRTKPVKGIEITAQDIDNAQAKVQHINDLKDAVTRLPVTQLLATFIAAAVNFRATDIHFETEKETVRIRYRIDGILHVLAVLPLESWHKIVTRIKTISKLKINVTTVPQDGSFSIARDNETIDVRVSVLPTNYGESIALRLLMPSSSIITLEELGLRDQALSVLKKEIQRPNGMIITTGPTGAGKTTTLYALLTDVNRDERKIITLEDPIEYKIPGINQSEVNTEKNYTFATGLKSILRQDPDVIMVGEMRDAPTVDTAIQAALTGHLVLSTLHTNSAAASIPRFLSLGAKPFLLAPASNAFMAQRLVRRICQGCKVEQEETDATKKARDLLGKLNTLPDTITDVRTTMFWKGNGCDHCHGVGYYGRVGIYEILQVTETIKQMILKGSVSEYDLEAAAMQEGMVPMVYDGMLKAADGITTVDEVLRVIE